MAFTVAEIAEANNGALNQLYLAMKPDATEAQQLPTMLAEPSGGISQRTLVDLCKTYGLELQVIVAGLRVQEVEALPEQTLKEIGEANRKDPHALYGLI
jgi:hypothetical protein